MAATCFICGGELADLLHFIRREGSEDLGLQSPLAFEPVHRKCFACPLASNEPVKRLLTTGTLYRRTPERFFIPA